MKKQKKIKITRNQRNWVCGINLNEVNKEERAKKEREKKRKEKRKKEGS